MNAPTLRASASSRLRAVKLDLNVVRITQNCHSAPLRIVGLTTVRLSEFFEPRKPGIEVRHRRNMEGEMIEARSRFRELGPVVSEMLLEAKRHPASDEAK